jgi:AcrR family transcriptional regulator
MGTRDKILETAREMFNEQGIENTSAKMIATKMRISDGNLRYHFRTKESLIYALYRQLAEGFDQQFVPLDTDHQFSLEQIYLMLESVYTRLYTHRYLMADFMAIMRKYPRIAQDYRQLIRRREQQFTRLIELFRQQGMLKSDIPMNQYRQMIQQFYVFSDAWIGHAEVFMKEAGAEEKIRHYVQLAFSIIAPYLTEEGKAQYAHALQEN